MIMSMLAKMKMINIDDNINLSNGSNNDDAVDVNNDSDK